MSKTARERLSTKFEIRSNADEKTNTFSGIASVFGSLVLPQPPSMMPTFIMPGAFARSLEQRMHKIKIKRDHEELVGGVDDAHESVQGLSIDSAHIEPTDGSLGGRNTLMLMRSGDLNELSIGFSPVASSVEYLRGADLVERLAKMNLDREIAARIRTNVQEHGESERYRVIKEVRLYEISIVEEGADPMTAITEVNKKQEGHMLMGHAELMAMVRELLDAAMSACEVEPPVEGAVPDPSADFKRYEQRTQIASLCCAIGTLLNMPVAEQMSESDAQRELRAGRVLNSKNMQMLRDHVSSVRAAADQIEKMCDAAEPQEGDSAASAKVTETPTPQKPGPQAEQAPVLPSERRERDKRQRERKARLAQIKIRSLK